MKPTLTPTVIGLLTLGVVATALALALPHGPPAAPQPPPLAAEFAAPDRTETGAVGRAALPRLEVPVDLPEPDLPEADPPAREKPETEGTALIPDPLPDGRRADDAPPRDTAAIRLAEIAAPEPPATPAPEAEMVAPAVRDVTAPGMTPGPRIDRPMVRQPVPEPPPLPPRWRRFFGVVAVDAGTLDLGPRRLKLAGIAAPAADADCTPDAAPSWPCGRAALTAFRLFLRSRAIECFLPPETLDDPVVGPCRLGETDLANWLVAQGWAEPAATAPEELRLAAARASCSGAGIWRGRASGDCPATP